MTKTINSMKLLKKKKNLCTLYLMKVQSVRINYNNYFEKLYTITVCMYVISLIIYF